MAYPWETQPAAPQRHSAPNVSGFGFVLVAAVAFLVGSYFPAKPFDFSSFRNRQSVVSIEKGSWLLIIEETEDRTKFPWIATIQSDAEFWEGVKSQGINWQFYDIESESVRSYRQDALQAGLPALIVVSPNGVVKVAKACPPTTEAISELLGKVK